MSQVKSYVAGVAGRYATALFGLAREDGLRDQVAADLGRLDAMLNEAPDLQTLIGNPLLTREAQGRGIGAIAEKAEFSDLTRRFLLLVAQNRRLLFLPYMIRAYGAFLAAERGEIDAQVTSAVKLTEAQESTLAKLLDKGTGKTVKLRTVVDEDLIGGLVVQVGSRMIDNSLRTKIQDLSVAMKEVG